ncbi:MULTISPECIES: alpha/beta fold hydrolase [unclassified Bradyrhizobium]|uniref:alpha/beta hydrolase family protein n=1 Tax=unclassified Bradyrhizobium TaxID=2631580 RepID=UPI0028EF2543|nr:MULTISPECIES: alpha/beta fold hydrolase [unclassified Bradyrhizobium]
MKDNSPQIVEYSTRDGARASLRLFLADDPNAPVIICVPAMGVRGRYYSAFAQMLRGSGFHVLTSDRRGVDSSSLRASRNCDFGYREIVDFDFPALFDVARQRFPSNERLLLGHSLGGQLSALYLSICPDAASALILVAAGNVYYKGWSGLRRWRLLGNMVRLRALAALLGYVPAQTIGFANDEARTVVVDWSNNCFTGRYVVANSTRDYEVSLQRLRKPVLAVSFELDQLAPQGSVESLLAKLASSSITRRYFAADDAAIAQAGHFDWVKRAGAVVEAIRSWADATLSPEAATGESVAGDDQRIGTAEDS